MASEAGSGTLLVPWTYLSAVLESNLTAHAKCVALVLFSHMSLKGEAVFPEIATIAREASLGVRSVQYARRELESRGFVAWELRGLTRRKWSARKYRLRLPSFEFDLPSAQSGVQDVHPCEVHDVHLSRRTTQRKNKTSPNPIPDNYSGMGHDGLGTWFETFFASYPNKHDKARAWRKLQAINPDAETRAQILEGLRRYRATTDLKMVPQASTWLRSEGWREALQRRIPFTCSTCGKPTPVGDGRGDYWCREHDPERRPS